MNNPDRVVFRMLVCIAILSVMVFHVMSIMTILNQ